MVELGREGAEEHADELTRRYTGKQHFFSDIYPVEQRRKETRVIALIEPLKVSLDAIFTQGSVMARVESEPAGAFGAPKKSQQQVAVT